MPRPDPSARPVSKVRKFPVGATWPTIQDALDAANAHLPDLGPIWANTTVIEQYQHLAAGILLGIKVPPVPPPEGAEDIVFDAGYWNAPPE